MAANKGASSGLGMSGPCSGPARVAFAISLVLVIMDAPATLRPVCAPSNFF